MISGSVGGKRERKRGKDSVLSVLSFFSPINNTRSNISRYLLSGLFFSFGFILWMLEREKLGEELRVLVYDAGLEGWREFLCGGWYFPCFFLFSVFWLADWLAGSISLAGDHTFERTIILSPVY